MKKFLLSEATKRNWEKLGVEKDFQKRLSKRANKKYSARKIMPIEYLSNSENLTTLEKILKYSKKISVKNIIFNVALNYLIKYDIIKVTNKNINTNNTSKIF